MHKLLINHTREFVAQDEALMALLSSQGQGALTERGFPPSTPLTTLRSKLLRFVPLRCGWKTPLPDNGSSIHQQPSPLRNIFLKKPHLHSPLRSLCDDSRGDGGEYH